MSDSNEILDMCRSPCQPQLQEHLEPDPLEQNSLYFGEGEPIQSPHPIPCANLTPSLATATPSTSLDWVEHFLLDDNGTSPVTTDPPPDHQLLNTSDVPPSQSRTSLSPPPGNSNGRILELPPEQLRRKEGESDIGESLWSRPYNPFASGQSSPRATDIPSRSRDSQSSVALNPHPDRLLNTSGSSRSQLRTSFSPPANANVSEEECVSWKPMIEIFYCKSLLKTINVDWRRERTLWGFSVRFADVEKPYKSLTHRTEEIANLGERISSGLLYLREKYNLKIESIELLSPYRPSFPVRQKQKKLGDTLLLAKRKRATLYVGEETIKPHYDKTLKQAAEAINISESKLKDTVRYYGYDSWTDFKFKTRNGLSGKATNLSLTRRLHGGGVSNTSANQNQPVSTTPHGNNRRVTVMAKYDEKNMMFDLTSQSKKEDLEREVTKREKDLPVGRFYLEYKDKAEVWIYIGCDEDLERCMDSFRLSDGSTPIAMRVRLNN